MNSFYIQETSYMKWKANIASFGLSIKINNENEEDILHFHLSYKYFTYQIIKNPCNENNVNITYKVMGRQQITQNIIHENSSRIIYSYIY